MRGCTAGFDILVIFTAVSCLTNTSAFLFGPAISSVMRNKIVGTSRWSLHMYDTQYDTGTSSTDPKSLWEMSSPRVIPYDKMRKEEEEYFEMQRSVLFNDLIDLTITVKEKAAVERRMTVSENDETVHYSEKLLLSLKSLIIEPDVETGSAFILTARRILRSSLLLFILLSSVFTLTYYLFPGSFLSLDSIRQFGTNVDVTNLPLTSLELPEYSESGGVVFFDNELPMAKSTVTVTPHNLVSDNAPKIVQ